LKPIIEIFYTLRLCFNVPMLTAPVPHSVVVVIFCNWYYDWND